MTGKISAKKSLGQHFLTDPGYCRKIVQFAAIDSSDRIIEIGSGSGLLTQELLASGARVTAIEFDRDMIEQLEKRWPDQADGRLRILPYDILQISWDEILDDNPVKIVGNLPYNISTRIIRRTTEIKDRFQSFTLMVQKEVAQKILAPSGGSDYGYFSLLMDYHFGRRHGFDVPPGAFYPPPRVMSHVLQLTPHEPPVAVPDPLRFEQILRAAFQQRRKTIWNNLRSSHFSTDRIAQALDHCQINPRRRPQELGLDEYACLSRML